MVHTDMCFSYPFVIMSGFQKHISGFKDTLIRTLPVSVYQSYDTSHDIFTLFVVIQPLLTFSSRDERVYDTPGPKFRH
jgi:hypothetical protein